MAGPADYLRVTGPLGGANFLSPAELGANIDHTQRTVGYMQQGANLRGTMQQNQQRQLEMDAAAEQQKQAAELKRQTSVVNQALWAPAPAAQPVAQQATMPAQQAAPVEAVAQQPATPTTQAPAQPAMAQPAPVAPQAPVQQVAQAPVAQPAAPATPAPQQATLPPTEVSETSRLRAVIDGDAVLPNGQPNPLSAAAFDQKRQVLAGLVQKGEISADFAQSYMQGMEGYRQKQIDRAVDLAEKTTKIASEDITRREKAVKLRAAEREAEDNVYNDIYQSLREGNTARAESVAAANGLAVDLEKDVKTIEARAKRSPDYREQVKAEREAAKETRDAEEAERKRLGVGTGKDVPAGVREVVVDGKVQYVDAEGRKLTTAQLESMGLRKAAAGASRVSVNTSEIDNQPIPQGAIRLKGIKADDQIKASDNLEASSVVIENAQRMKQLYPEVVAASGINPNDSAFSAKFKNWVAKNVDNNPAAREYDTRRQQLVNANLRLNKGAQTEGDAQRERDALTSADMPLKSHTETVDSIISRAARQRQQAQSIMRGYIRPGEEAPAQPAASSPGVSDFAKYKRGGK